MAAVASRAALLASVLSTSVPSRAFSHSSRRSISSAATAFFRTPSSRSKAAASASSAGLKMSSSASASASGTNKKDVPYGAWKSPITSKAITAGSVALGSLKVSESGDLYWLEGRPQEGGRYVLCRYAPDDDAKSERNAVDVTPHESNARTRVHEYGGAGVTYGEDDGSIYYSDFATQRLVKIKAGEGGGEPVALTPDDNRFRFADGRVLGDKLYMVREDHKDPAPKDVVNEIASVGTGDGTMETIATGNDFYGAPRPSPDGTKLAYITWNHPNMPWDATELRVVSIGEEGTSSAESSRHELIAGSDGDTSVMQPMWHPVTGDLYYVSDETGYYNIYRSEIGSGAGPVNVLPMDRDFGGASPGWSLGQQGFNFLDDGRLIATYNKDGATRLVVADVSGDGPATDVMEYGADDGLPMQLGGVVPAGGDTVYFVGGSPSDPTSVYRWAVSEKGDAAMLACSSTLKFDRSVISVPRQVEFPTVMGTAYGYYYAPANGEYECTTDKAPPLLVKAHGGPTACTGTSFNAGIQYWTSRGFAILDVDYGGSTGYGRDYRRRLRGNWGVVDIDDVCAGAKYLVDQGLADGERVCIDGGSAGGYTTLGALAFRDVFTAGCSLYGIGDLTALAGDTHKFESRYLDGLVGPYPKEEALYKGRSPIESVDTLSCPILLLQGAEDKVVPPNQAKMMHEALKSKGLPTCLKIYEAEQHGFRRAENIEDALDSELAFFGRVFGIDVPGALELDIDNM